MSRAGGGIAGFRVVLAAGAIIAALALLPSGAQGRVGGLDPSFGEGGRLTTEFTLSDHLEMAVGPDGTIVLAAGARFTRLLPDGRPDPSFGEGGALRLDMDFDGLDFRSESIAVDSRNRVVVFGTAEDPSRYVGPFAPLLGVHPSWALVVRLTADGRLDPSFGEGRGFIRSDFGLLSRPTPELPAVQTSSGRVDSRDRPVLIVRTAELTGRCNIGHTGVTYYPRAVARLTAAGAPDPGFGGGDGLSELGGGEGTSHLLLDGSDGIAVAVASGNCRKRGERVIRFGPDGELLSEFGIGGRRYYPRRYLSLIEPSGSMILAGPYFTYIRTAADGERDLRFGKKGFARARLERGVHRGLWPLGFDPQGRIVLVGSFGLPRDAGGKLLRGYVTLARLLPSGKLDRGFGAEGWIATGFSRPRVISVDAAMLDPQGRALVAVGSNSARQPPGLQRVVLVRYLLDE